jgi:hypothetical protein
MKLVFSDTSLMIVVILNQSSMGKGKAIVKEK